MNMTAEEKLNTLREKNPAIPIHNCRSAEFQRFGRLLSNFDFAPFRPVTEKSPNPQAGVEYIAGIRELEELPLSAEIRNRLFGELPIQVGWCRGFNTTLNALEYHKSSEAVIAMSDLLLLLGTTGDIHTGDFAHGDSNHGDSALRPSGSDAGGPRFHQAFSPLFFLKRPGGMEKISEETAHSSWKRGRVPKMGSKTVNQKETI